MAGSGTRSSHGQSGKRVNSDEGTLARTLMSSAGPIGYAATEFGRLLRAAGTEWRLFTSRPASESCGKQRTESKKEEDRNKKPGEIKDTASPKPTLDIDKMTEYVTKNALAKSYGNCAVFCRKAFEAGGMNTDARPASAGNYGPFLLRKGFVTVSSEGYSPQKGDVAVFNIDLGLKRRDGHIQIYNGARWVSDFVQNNFSPYREGTPASTIYRFSK